MKYLRKNLDFNYVKKKPQMEWIKKGEESNENISKNLPSATKKTPHTKNVFSFNFSKKENDQH